MTKKKACRKPLEKNFAKKVDQFLLIIPGVQLFNIQALQVRGIPDRMGTIGGRAVLLELKREPPKKPYRGREKLQAKTLRDYALAGAYARFVYPENWDEIREDLLLLSGFPQKSFALPDDLSLEHLNPKD